MSESPIKQGSFHVEFPEPATKEEADIAKTIESEIHKFENSHGNVDC
jgi:hypothetical protein